MLEGDTGKETLWGELESIFAYAVVMQTHVGDGFPDPEDAGTDCAYANVLQLGAVSKVNI
jgi:hypothetical protein